MQHGFFTTRPDEATATTLRCALVAPLWLQFNVAPRKNRPKTTPFLAIEDLTPMHLYWTSYKKGGAIMITWFTIAGIVLNFVQAILAALGVHPLAPKQS